VPAAGWGVARVDPGNAEAAKLDPQVPDHRLRHFGQEFQRHGLRPGEPVTWWNDPPPAAAMAFITPARSCWKRRSSGMCRACPR